VEGFVTQIWIAIQYLQTPTFENKVQLWPISRCVIRRFLCP